MLVLGATIAAILFALVFVMALVTGAYRISSPKAAIVFVART